MKILYKVKYGKIMGGGVKGRIHHILEKIPLQLKKKFKNILHL